MTYLDGEAVALPRTIKDVRAALPPERRGEFDRAVSEAPAEELFGLVGHWAIETRPDLRAKDESLFAQLEAGDFSGFTAEEDLDR
ncbi:hypothetical protein ACL02R_16670 [Streptomyces sp. MS19]|uniref:hypothetical protein n=1 Tax=Streptomyces sp. MS19 TaxID=3385972 RepID=UPI0039A3F3A9